jgi:hypothetical protein
MNTPSNKEMLARFQKINESEALKESGPEDNAGFKAGEDVSIKSKDDHSKPVSRKTDPGVKDAPKDYDAKDKKMDTDGGNKRDPGAEKAQDKFEGSEKAANDKTDQERTAGGPSKIAAAKGAAKSFAEFRDTIRAKMGLSLDDKLNKGNDGKLH